MKSALILSVALLAGCATSSKDHGAYSGVAADGITTAIGLSAPNIVEANPLGWWTIPLRIALVEHAKTLPPHEGVPVLHATAAVGWGAAANNLLVLAGVSAAPVVGIAVGIYLWHQGAEQREKLVHCEVVRRLENNPNLVCAFLEDAT